VGGQAHLGRQASAPIDHVVLGTLRSTPRTEFPNDTVVAIGHEDTLAGIETRRFLLERNESGIAVREDKVTPHQAWA
jgi:hypothetical protein